MDVQRLFWAFPSGPPGIGLLMLRVSVALALVLSFSWHQGIAPAGIAASWVICLALCGGYFTPVAAMLAFVLQGALLCLRLLSVEASLIPLVDAVALALLGPGAYSLDARRFGRRVASQPSART
jgi:hypothetical protein